MILHIPHSSQFFPPEIIPSTELIESISKMTDWYTDELFSNGTARLIFPYSRLFCDVERLVTDANAYYGQGIVYTKGWNEQPINFDVDDWTRLEYYKDHHNKMKQMVERQLSYIEKCVIVDCHSYSFEQANVDMHECADICIGTNEDTTSQELKDLVVNSFIEMGYTVEINFPYSNSILPWNKSYEGLESIMIEVNKSIYMNERYGKSENFDKVKDDISKVLELIKAYEFS